MNLNHTGLINIFHPLGRFLVLLQACSGRPKGAALKVLLFILLALLEARAAIDHTTHYNLANDIKNQSSLQLLLRSDIVVPVKQLPVAAPPSQSAPLRSPWIPAQQLPNFAPIFP